MISILPEHNIQRTQDTLYRISWFVFAFTFFPTKEEAQALLLILEREHFVLIFKESTCFYATKTDNILIWKTELNSSILLLNINNIYVYTYIIYPHPTVDDETRLVYLQTVVGFLL